MGNFSTYMSLYEQEIEMEMERLSSDVYLCNNQTKTISSNFLPSSLTRDSLILSHSIFSLSLSHSYSSFYAIQPSPSQ